LQAGWCAEDHRLPQQVDMVDDKDLVDLVEEEVKTSLQKQGYTDAPVIRGSGLKALESKDLNDEWSQKGA
jgi:translation elongation factor EF-Tu-like GTPase